MPLKSGRKLKGTPFERKVKIRRSWTDRGFNRFAKRTKSISGKTLTEIAPERDALSFPFLSIKKVGRSKRYKVRYRPLIGTKPAKEDLRRIIFQYERGFRLNPHSYLDNLETKLDWILDPERSEKKFGGKGISLEKLDQEIETAIVETEHWMADELLKIALAFPSRPSFVWAFARMTQKRHRLRKALEELNRIKIVGESESEREIVKNIYLRILHYLYLEAIKARERAGLK